MSRYIGRDAALNSNQLYAKKFEDRGIKSIYHYYSPEFRYPTAIEIAFRLENVPYVWKTGDRYFKLANEYYGDVSKWWVIALFNQKPTEAHVKLGDIIYIPTPVESAISLLKV